MQEHHFFIVLHNLKEFCRTCQCNQAHIRSQYLRSYLESQHFQKNRNLLDLQYKRLHFYLRYPCGSLRVLCQNYQ
jgi:hypothetical protein